MDAFAGVCPQSGTAPLPTKRPRTRRSPWPSPRTCQPAPPTSRTTEGKKVPENAPPPVRNVKRCLKGISENLCQSGSNNGASIPRAPQKKKKKFEDVTTKSMTCVQMAKMYSYFKSYTPSGRYLIDILNPLGKIHIKNRGEKNRKEIHLGHWQQRLKRIPLSHGMSLKSPILRNS